MQGPSNPSDPKATVVHITDDPAGYPQVAGYRIQRKLGHGGMATVYLALQDTLDRPVSIKVMERDALQDEVSKQRFENEARTIARLSHPSIVSIYEVGRTADGRLYYSMPFLPNGDLAQRDLGKDEQRIVDLLRTLLAALDYAHARGIVHRDVKQENVLFDADNRPLLADFGIALTKSDDVRITTAGFAVGSSGYMAPEQARGDAVDGRADLYSVGVLAYELLTGDLPFRSTDAFALALMHAQKDIPRLPPAKRHWQGFIDRALAKSPDQRFQNAQQMLSALDRIGRHTGNHLSSRVLRRFDQALSGKGWKSPVVLTLAGVAVLATGLYVERDRLFQAAAPAASVQPPATPATPNVTTPRDVSLMSSPPSNLADSPPITMPVPVPPAAASVASASSASATAATATAAAVDAALRDGRASLEYGDLDRAAHRAEAAWELAPARADTGKLVADVLAAMSAQEVKATAARDDQHVLILFAHAISLVNTTISMNAPPWHAFKTAANAAFRSREQKQTAASDSAGRARTQALASDIHRILGNETISTVPAPTPQPAAAPVAVAPSPPEPAAATVASPDQSVGVNTGVAMAVDEQGFVFLHGPINGFPGAAIARTEVTRQQYSEFVNATQHAPSTCAKADASGPASQRNWSSPGFPQNSDHPVVCVSWDDAAAYVKWLSQRNGHRYRLPSHAEWRLMTLAGTGSTVTGNGTAAATAGTPNSLGLIGLDGNVGEWLFDCADSCQKHLVAGRSWRNRGGDGPTPREGERGFDDIGFRLVRVLGGHARANAAASASTSVEPVPASTEPNPPTTEPTSKGHPRLFGRRHRKN